MVVRTRVPLLEGRRGFLRCALAGSVILLGGCAVTVPGSETPPQRIRLSSATEFAPGTPSVGWVLRVQEPQTTLSLDTARVVYIAPGGDIQYLSTAEWASRGPEMVMELLVESFQNSNRILTVGDRRSRIRPDFELESRLTHFQVDANGADAGLVRVGLDVSLMQRPRRNSVGSFRFESETLIDPISLANIRAGFNESLEEVMSLVVEWTLQTGASV